MTEMQGLPAALGIEAVECLSEGGPNLVVRVTGRWRRRRADWHGQPVLVVEAEGRRHRFPAMPEPPSLTGVVPGTWRMTFAVPAELGPHLATGTSLQLGAAVVPLPVTVTPSSASRSPPVDPELLAARRRRSSELAAESERRRAAEAEAAAGELRARVEQLEAQLEEAGREAARLSDAISARERERRLAEQLAHAEHVERIEAAERVAERERASRSERDSLRTRVRELERELDRARRAAAEARHLALVRRPERPETPAPSGLPEDVLRRESELALRRPGPARRRPAPPGDPSRSEALLRAERDTIGGWGRAELLRVRGELEEQRRRSARVYEGIEQLRREIAGLRAAARPSQAESGAPPRPGQVEAERLSAALSKLRATIPPEPVEAAPPAGPRRGVLARLAARLRRRSA